MPRFLANVKSLLLSLLAGSLVVVLLMLMPVPEDVDPRFYSAASAVIPLLLIAVLGRLRSEGADGEELSLSMADLPYERRELFLEVTKRIADIRKLEQRCQGLEGSRDLKIENDLVESRRRLANARAENELLLERVENLPESTGGLFLANMALVICLTFIAATGEASTLWQLAEGGDSPGAFVAAVGTIAALFVGLVYFEVMPWYIARRLQALSRARVKELMEA